MTSHPHDNLLRGECLEEALARLAFLIERRRQLGVMVGPAGIGKTTALSLLADELKAPGRSVVRMNAAGMTPAALLASLTAELGLGRRSQRFPDRQDLLRDYLRGLSASSESVALLLDDLDLAEDECWNLLLLLLRGGQDSRVTIVAAVSDVDAGARRDVTRRCAEFVVRLVPWTSQETARYSLGVMAGQRRRGEGTACVIDDCGLSALHDVSQGIPGRLRRVLELSLLACEALEESHLTAPIVLASAAELFPTGTHRFAACTV